MRQTEFDVDERSGEVKLGVKIDTSEQDRLNALARKELGKGFTKDRTMRAVADIPYDFLFSLKQSGDLAGTVLMDATSSRSERRKALRNLLYRYPEFRISDGNI